MEDKICPLLSIGRDDYEYDYEYCKEGKCAWWVNGCTIEGVPIKCCALDYIAMKCPQDGLYRV